MPKAGHIAIFDRTWYGRVMVERIEGFCSEADWKRAYQEINEMEEHMANFGAVILKFWIHIDKDEQERRFKERMEDPAKQWKITDEDWRNREKWDAYEQAVNEMLVRTSTTYAPVDDHRRKFQIFRARQGAGNGCGGDGGEDP
jgi:poly_P_AMP_trns: polyphosphate:AMP phosphotransferase